jgi:hypothetical protein
MSEKIKEKLLDVVDRLMDVDTLPGTSQRSLDASIDIILDIIKKDI